ncbi:MAG TPA: hypothetical protein VNW97_05890 [Candidatus Saccharimonadales bacterium]|jgi:hypothetical protein|nr:hypothetical protein [Candidatus Saccharimonadales bacterium]
MKGYIYTMYAGADPSHGWTMNDPIFGKVPTLGACVPNIRRVVEEGDYIFVISGRIPGQRQFVVGGMQVKEKIDALAAYRRFPEHRLKREADGTVKGNIIVNHNGTHNALDEHSNFEKRIENYIVGCNPTVFEKPEEFNLARTQTVGKLEEIFRRPGDRVFDIIGRYRRMNDEQVKELLSWMRSIKQ